LIHFYKRLKLIPGPEIKELTWKIGSHPVREQGSLKINILNLMMNLMAPAFLLRFF
jgi:hypothetical protein